MWDCLVPQWLSDNFTNTMERSETIFCTSRVVRQLHKHDRTKWDCLVPQSCQKTSETRWNEVRLFSTSVVVKQLHKHDGTKWDRLLPQWMSDNFTNTMGQNETVEYFHGCRRTSQTRWGNVRLFSTSRVVGQLPKHDGTMWDCLVPQGLSDNFTNTMEQSETLFYTSRVVRQRHKHDGTKWDYLSLQLLSTNFTNTMGQSETV